MGLQWPWQQYPSWRLRRPSRWWRRPLIALQVPRNAVVMSLLVGLPLVTYGVVFLKSPDYAVVDLLLKEKSYSFYSDQAAPRFVGGQVAPCTSRIAGDDSNPRNLIAVSGVSVPNVLGFIECAKGDLRANRADVGPGADWGSSRNIVDALVAQEDRFYWSRDGLSLYELFAGFAANLRSRGGSNISMQLIKNLYFRQANQEEEGFLERIFRNLYARTHQAELEEHVRAKLAEMQHVKPSSITTLQAKSALLGLYLQTAHTDAPPKEDEALQVCKPKKEETRLMEVIGSHPQCLGLMGVGRIARRYFGKRLDQLTIAESVSVVASLRSPRFGIAMDRWMSYPDCDKGLGSNKCWSAHILRVMANDPDAIGEHAMGSMLMGDLRRLIPREQLPEEMAQRNVPYITKDQARAALEQLSHLVYCGQPFSGGQDAATRNAIRERQRWCRVAGAGSNRSDSLGVSLAAVLKPELDAVHAEDSSEIAVYTSLNPEAQRAAEAALRTAPGNQDYPGHKMPAPAVAGLVTLTAEGQIKALVVAGDVKASGSPGSTLKPFVFGTHLTDAQLAGGAGAARSAFENALWDNNCEDAPVLAVAGNNWPVARPGECGYRAGVPVSWLPHNSDGDREIGFYGACNGQVAGGKGSLRESLCRSLNTVTAEVALATGRDRIAETMAKLGIIFPEASWNQGVIGEGGVEVRPIELASAYTVFLNQGKRAPPWAVRMTITTNRREPRSPPATSVIFSSEVTNLLRDGLRDVVFDRHGTAFLANLSALEVSGKTGTTVGDGWTKPRDVWFAGYQDGVRREVTVVWLSYKVPRLKDNNGKVLPGPAGLGYVEGLYGRDAAIVYRTYLEKRAALEKAGQKGPGQ